MKILNMQDSYKLQTCAVQVHGTPVKRRRSMGASGEGATEEQTVHGAGPQVSQSHRHASEDIARLQDLQKCIT